MKYYIYILECKNEKLYTGITTDVERRLLEHSRMEKDYSNKGAKFTRAFKPRRLVALWQCEGRSSASKLEYRIKQLRRDEKKLLIKNEKKYFDLFFEEYLNKSEYKKISVSKFNDSIENMDL